MPVVFQCGGLRTNSPAATTFTTTFTGTENPLSQSGRWLNGATDGLDWKDYQVSNPRACAAAFSSTSPPPFNDAVTILKSSVFTPPANQYVEVVISTANGYAPGGTHEIGIFLRASMSAHSITGYEFYLGISAANGIVRWNGALNDFNGIGSGTTSNPASGDVLRAEAIGSTLNFYKNSILIATCTDTNYTSGQPGMQAYVVGAGGNDVTAHGFSSFTCGPM